MALYKFCVKKYIPINTLQGTYLQSTILTAAMKNILSGIRNFYSRYDYKYIIAQFSWDEFHWRTIPAGLTLVENPPYAQFHFRRRIIFQFVSICPWNTCMSYIVSSSITSRVSIRDIQGRIDTVYPKCKTIYLILTHWGRVMQICVSKPSIIDQATSHYLNQCWNIINWTPRNKLQWKFNRNV